MTEKNGKSSGNQVVGEPVQVEKSGSLLIWLLPVIAAMIAGWLLYKGISEAGVDVFIEFESAEGIVEKKTKVLYKGLNVGVVKKVTINPDLHSVLVEAEMKPEVEGHLREGTRFWLVRPKVSLTEVTGLETLVSGNYIAVSPGEGTMRYRFKALPKSPPMDESSPGLHVKLTAEKLGSIGVGSRVYYRDIPVGRVEGVDLVNGTQGVSIGIQIEEQYAHLVKKKSRFWNVSGVDIKAGLSGVEIRTGTVASIISGGISFYTPPGYELYEQCEGGEQFSLYEDYGSAEDGIIVKLYLPEGEGISADKTIIRSDGLEVGVVKQVDVDNALRTTAVVKFHPHARTLLRNDSKFWLVDPEFSLTRLPNISTMLQGKYIAIKGGDGEPKFEFDVLRKRPASDRSKVGLYLTLIAEELGSLEVGSPIFYRKIKVGTVEGFQLDKHGKKVEIQLHIEEKYIHLVNKQSRFWNASGVNLRAGIEGLKLRIESVSSLLAGGVGFFNPETGQNLVRAVNDDRFHLYEDKESAEHDSLPKLDRSKAGLYLTLIANELGSLEKGSSILYRKIKVGNVEGFKLDKEGKAVEIQLYIKEKYAHLVNKQSRFWNASGISLRAGLDGVKLRAESVNSLLAGGVAFYNPEVKQKPDQAVMDDRFHLYEDRESARHDSFPVQIVFDSANGLQEGAAVKFQGLTVGKVRQIELTGEQAHVVVQALMYRKSRSLVRKESQFWIVQPQLGLLKTDNLDTLVSGRYIALKPGKGLETDKFKGEVIPPVKDDLPGLHLTLVSSRLGSIKPGAPLYYRQIVVGSVTGSSLAPKNNAVLIHVIVDQKQTHLIRDNSRFWQVSGVHIAASLFGGIQVETDSVESILSGGIAFATPEGELMGNRVSNNHTFELNKKMEAAWAEWAPEISQEQ